MGKQLSRIIYIRRDTIHQGHSMLASSIGTYRPVIVMEIKYRAYRPVKVLEVKYRTYRTYRPVIVLEVKYTDLQTCDSPRGKIKDLQTCDSPGGEVQGPTDL